MMTGTGQFKQFIFGDTVISGEALRFVEIKKLISKGKDLKERGAIPSQDDILDVFSRLRKAWSDPLYPKRREACDALKKNSDMGAEFIEMVLKEFPKLLAPEYLLKKLEGELGSVEIQKRLIAQKEPHIRFIVQPAGQVLHVASGNVFLACIESLTSGILTRNVNFLKMSTDDRDFPVIFAESIREFDKKGTISRSLAVLWWSGGSEAIENLFKQNMDRIVFWGGADALKSWQKDLGESAVLIRHGPKISFGVVSCRGLGSTELSGLTDKIALDISIWEQRACNCPQALFVESSVSNNEMKYFIDALSGSLRKVTAAFPPGRRSDDECVEIMKTRELAIAARLAAGKNISVIGPETFDWTIIFEDSNEVKEFEPSPFNRTILIRRYASLNALLDLFKEYSSYLQTVGCCLEASEVPEYAVKLSALGVTRVCPFGIMAIPAAGTPHDGSFALRDLTKFTVVEF